MDVMIDINVKKDIRTRELLALNPWDLFGLHEEGRVWSMIKYLVF